MKKLRLSKHTVRQLDNVETRQPRGGLPDDGTQSRFPPCESYYCPRVSDLCTYKRYCE